MKHAHDMPFGASVLEGGGVRFRLWAPGVDRVALTLHDADAAPRRLAMHRDAAGWHERVVADAAPGARYSFAMPDGRQVPDPASRSNPDGVHAPSEVVDPCAYGWHDEGWRGRPWHETVVYELHLGAFTAAGTYLAAIERLPDLVALGVTTIELMPLASFPGARGWGYDGVLPFAPQSSYGRPDELKRLVDAAHGLGLAITIDVVYNHFGPEGNYLPGYAPEFFNAAHHTPWGAAINFDGARSREVRDFFVHNALYWIEEFHFDGLRMDAVHAIRDDSEPFICREIGAAIRAFGARCEPPRQVHLMLENDDNRASLLERGEGGAPRVADAQWSDDFHHAAHVLATGETDNYYADYADAPLKLFGRALAEGFAWQGQPSAFRGGRARGEPSGQLTSVAFVGFLQNHDQIGNRAFGERVDALAGARDHGRERLQALHACLLLSPQVPLLFMGEEFAATAPFQYFCDFAPDLASAVAKGRRDEFNHGGESWRARIPDPNAPASFVACKLDWDERYAPAHARCWNAMRDLLALRAAHLVPRLAHPTLGGNATVDGELLSVHWVLGEGSVWHLALNLGDTGVELPAAGAPVFALRADARGLQPRGVRVSVESAAPAGDAGGGGVGERAAAQADREPA